ncbi:MAG: hypothetical protein IPO32_19175 [Crocinitomicaceae bacterium]|nr:hypothetical protein [Crocinitomicaceae bacterium]
MIINNYEVLPGKNATLRIPVASLPSGNTVNLFAHVSQQKAGAYYACNWWNSWR